MCLCLKDLLKWYYGLFVFRRPLEVVQNDVFMCSSDFLKRYYSILLCFIAFLNWQYGDLDVRENTLVVVVWCHINKLKYPLAVAVW